MQRACGEDLLQMNSDRERIKSLQALRAMAFLGIFFAHANFFISWSALGVSVFYVLSGFLMMNTRQNKEWKPSAGNSLKFAMGKIKRLYPLHIVTMVFAVILSLAVMLWHGEGIKSYLELAGEIVLHILLLQTWVPHASVSVSLNGVAWYLSAAAFLYFVFPYAASWIRRKRNSFLVFLCVAILGMEILSCIPFIYFLGDNSFVYIWFMYFFPLFRLGDFVIGCCFGKVYGERAAGAETGLRGGLSLKYSAMELAATALTVGVLLWMKHGSHTNIVLTAFRNWTTLYIPLAVVWTYLFTVNRGVITYFLNNRLLVGLGNISGYIFLIHYVVILYVNNMLNFLDMELSDGWRAAVAVLELGASIISALIYMAIEKRVRKTFSKGKGMT